MCSKMNISISDLLKKHRLQAHQALIESYWKQAIGFSLSRYEGDKPMGGSRVGGYPDLPADFVQPENNDRPLDYLLQATKIQKPRSYPKLPMNGSFYFNLILIGASKCGETAECCTSGFEARI